MCNHQIVSATKRALFYLLPIFCSFFTAVFSEPVQAKLFQNSYLSFDLPDRWQCTSEGTEWICRSELDSNSKEAIIILTAKEVGPSDTLDLYQDHLKSTKSIPGPRGEAIKSEVKNLTRIKIAGHEWVDGLHVSSEIPNYYTRYLATAKERIAILVTFSAHKKYYTKYSTDFIKAIQSLRVIATADLFKPKSGASGQGGGEELGVPLGQGGAEVGPGSEDLPGEDSGGASKDKKQKIFIIGFIMAALGFYIFLKYNKS